MLINANANIIFMGTPDIAVPTLEALHNRYNISAVVTVPDKQKGRGMKLLPSSVKIKAIELGLNILQPENLKDNDFINTLKALAPDIIVVFAFRFLPKEVYQIARVAAFNIHTSLLPKYRGAAPINWAIINGESCSGLTSFILDDRIDTGAIIMQEQITIPHNATAGELYSIMMEKAPDFAINTCEQLLSGIFTLTIQESHFECPAPKLFKNDTEINWNLHAAQVVNFINGCSPVPCAWTTWQGTKLQIIRAKIPLNKDIEKNINSILTLTQTGEFFIGNDIFIVNCNMGIVELVEIKQENKKAVLVKDFINGYRGVSKGLLSK
jgi:methionyl-tRNA formyltransferase